MPQHSDDWKTKITQVRAAAPSTETGEQACLVLIYPAGVELGKRYEMASGSDVVIGRGSDCQIQVDRDSVSRRHARIGFTPEGWQLSDLGSTNGSYVNDAPISSCHLRDGDLVKIGNAIFKFLVGGNVEASYHEEIYRMTICDGLTGAHNKRYFTETLDKELMRAARHGRPLSLLMLDIDHFKQVNDKCGHLTGDYVLREMARRIAGRVRKDEVFARYGGEEFGLILPETSLEQALKVGEDVRKLVAAEPFVFDADTLQITISVGVGTTNHEIAVDAFVRIADDNLYKAKRSGRNRVVG